MVPYSPLKERIIAWLLWELEASQGWGGSWDDDMEGAEWMLMNNEHMSFSYSMSLLRNYYYVKQRRLRG